MEEENLENIAKQEDKNFEASFIDNNESYNNSKIIVKLLREL